MRRIPRPGPAMVVASIALFAGLTGGALGAQIVPLAKRALTADKAKRATLADRAIRAVLADNASRLDGKTAAQVAALVQIPPVSDVSGLLSTKTGAWSLQPNQGTAFTISCDSGAKATGGGYDNPVGETVSFDTSPTADGTGWKIFLGNVGSSVASGTLFVVCLK